MSTQAGRAADRGIPVWGSIPGPQDHNLSWRQMLHCQSHLGTPFFSFFKRILSIYSWVTQREAETQAEEEAGSLRGAQCGTQSWTPGSWPEPKADAQPLSHPGVPLFFFFIFFLILGNSLYKCHSLFWEASTKHDFWNKIGKEIRTSPVC